MTLTHTQEADDYVTVSEAAKIASLSPDTIRRYSDKGILATLRTPSNHRRFLRTNVVALIKPAPAPAGGVGALAAVDAASTSAPEASSTASGAEPDSSDGQTWPAS